MEDCAMWKAFFVFFIMFVAVSCGDNNDQTQKDDDQIQADDDQDQTDDDQIQTDVDQTWTDPDTKYVWSSKISGINLQDALQYCDNLSENGRSDWHLPNISELRTLVKECKATESKGECGVTEYCTYGECWSDVCEGCKGSDTVSFSKIGDRLVLLSSSLTQNDVSAWTLNFRNGSIFAKELLTVFGAVRCVAIDPGAERTQPCKGPDNVAWNTVEKITQTWDGTEWKPSSTGEYNETGSDKECRFICENSTYNAETALCECDPGYRQGDGKCVAIANPCAVNQCGDLECVPERINDEDKYTGAFTCMDDRNNYIWSEVSSDYMIIADAEKYCEDLVSAGYDDWHLPMIEALRMLIKNCPQTETDGACPATYDAFPPASCEGCENMEDGRYSMLGDSLKIWAATNSFGAWYIDFMKAEIDGYDWPSGGISTVHRHVRCVRY
jgi:hypothetical protein